MKILRHAKIGFVERAAKFPKRILVNLTIIVRNV